MKKCKKCFSNKSSKKFTIRKANRDGLDCVCKKCRAAKSLEYYYNHIGRYKETRKVYADKLRLDALVAYSQNPPFCKCCGEKEQRFLCIDHINGNGGDERKKIGHTTQFYLYLRRNKYPNGYQILCHNCNMARAFYGECPHKKQ